MPPTPPSQVPSPAPFDDARSPPGTPPTAGPGAAAAPDDAHHPTPALAADGGMDGAARALPDPGTPLGTPRDTSPPENRAMYGVSPDSALRADGAAAAGDSGPALRARTRLDFNPDGTGFQAADHADDLRVSLADEPESALGIPPRFPAPDTTPDASNVVSSAVAASPPSGPHARAQQRAPGFVFMTKQRQYVKAIERGCKDAALFFHLARTLSGSATVAVPHHGLMSKRQLYLKAIERGCTRAELYYHLGRTLSSTETITVPGFDSLTQLQLYAMATRATMAAPVPRTVDALHARLDAQAPSQAAAAAASSPSKPSFPGGPSATHQQSPASQHKEDVPDHLVRPGLLANERKRRREMGRLIDAVLRTVHPTRGWTRLQCEDLAWAGCRVHALPSKAQHARDGGRLARAHDSTQGPSRLPGTRLFLPLGAAAPATGPFAVHLSHVEHQPYPSTVFVMRPGAPDTLQRVDVPASATAAVPLTGMMGWTAADAAKQLVVLVGTTPSDLGQASPPA